MTLLAPGLVEAILDGRQEEGLTLPRPLPWLAEATKDGPDSSYLAKLHTMLHPHTNSAVAPPPPTQADTRQVKALTQAVAKEVRRHGAPPLELASTAWLESRPQSLWPLLDAAVAASTARRRDEALITAGRWLLANQLELIRYRLERGHDWARVMLDAYPEKLIALALAKTLPEADWHELVNLLNIAKVPTRPEVMQALAQAAVDATPGEAPSLEAIPQQLRSLLDEIGGSVSDPFMVVEALAEIGALMPAELRAYIAHELGLSPHAVLREAVPLLLLDHEPAVRRAAAAVLDQVAGPERLSPMMLRRTLLVRNWVPQTEREAIDRLIRKARLKGVVCAQWAAAPALAIHCSMVDGSGAQHLTLTSPTGRTGLFAGLLLKQGFGIRDAWYALAAPRREITSALKGGQRQTASHAVMREHLDTVVQHAIALGLKQAHLPPPAMVAIAEAIGAADWKDRALDVKTEVARLFAGLGTEHHSQAAIAASLQRSGAWVADDPMMQSWFDDDAAIRALAQRRPRLKPEAAVRQMLEEVLSTRRETWAERQLLQALWLQAGTGDAKPTPHWRDCVVLAHELLAGRALAELPAMVAIAERSIFAARVGTW